MLVVSLQELTEEEVSLVVVEAEDGQRLAAGSKFPVGHVVSGVDQFDQSSLPAGCQNAAVLSRGAASPGHQHRGPGQGEELLLRGTTNTSRLYHDTNSQFYPDILN